ncbi:MAG: chromate efflux transporter [Xenococcaceae cyanobacterium MO_188.B19]|nr:chromate efflux transporter [Xenococcaceae cyanobacterium MO_188.B19]
MVEQVNFDSYDGDDSKSVSLSYLFWNFLKIGSTAFGGFMALVSVIENIIVGKRKLLTHEDMLDGISLASVLPGPLAANVVAYVGYRLRGGWGALMTTTAVLLPSFALVTGLAHIYTTTSQDNSTLDSVFAGFIPAVIAIIFSAAYRMSQKAVTGWKEIAILLASAIILANVDKKSDIGLYIPVILIAVSGLIGWFLYRHRVERDLSKNANSSPQKQFNWKSIGIPLTILVVCLLLYLVPLPLAQNSLAKLATTFAGMSLTLFGGGYVAIPIIEQVVVHTYDWLTLPEFGSAIAVGQITPGPILISAAFIGYKVQGIMGALVSTFAIFAPPALLMVTMSNILEHIKQSVFIQAALKGVRPAVIGMIFIAGIVLAQTAPLHWASLLIFAASLIGIWRFKLEVVLIIPLAGLIGLLLY